MPVIFNPRQPRFWNEASLPPPQQPLGEVAGEREAGELLSCLF